MLKLLTLTLWLLSLTVALFVLAIDVWEGAAPWYFVGATLLGMIGPLGTWAIAKTHPQTDRAAWVCIGLTGGAVVGVKVRYLVDKVQKAIENSGPMCYNSK